VDVWIVLWINVFEFEMERRIAGAGQAGIAFIDLDEGITVMEVGVVVVSWKPAGGVVWSELWYFRSLSTYSSCNSICAARYLLDGERLSGVLCI
jgi:hypothetical protein